MRLPERRGLRVGLLAALVAAGTSLLLAVPLAFHEWSAGNDWIYFDSLAWVVRSSVLHYGVFPLHDPWVCGGIDLLANPQARLFSPLTLLDLALTPHAAALATLWLYVAGGWLAMTALLRRLGHDRTLALLGGWIFVGSSWFALHWSEGHLRFGAMTLLPAVALALVALGERRLQLLLAALLSFFLLDGAIYTFVYSLYLGLAMTLVGLVPWRAAWRGVRDSPWWSLALVAATLALWAGKVLPVLASHGSGSRFAVSRTLDTELLRIFFWPVQVKQFGFGDGALRFHEFGLYLGVVSAACVGWALLRRGLWRSHRAWILVALLFFWMATNWGGVWNPWSVAEQVPLVCNARVQSRLFVVMWLAWVVLLTATLAALRSHRRLFAVLAVFLALEGVAVSSTTWFAGYAWGRPRLRADVTAPLLTVSEWDHTIGNAAKPEHYGKGLGSRACYEPVHPRVAVRHVGEAHYEGEISAAATRGSATLLSITPGEVRFSWRGQVPTTVTVNQNALSGWEVVEGHASVIPGRPRLQLRVLQPGEISVRYRPWYWPTLAWLQLFGALALAALWLRTRNTGVDSIRRSEA